MATFELVMIVQNLELEFVSSCLDTAINKMLVEERQCVHGHNNVCLH